MDYEGKIQELRSKIYDLTALRESQRRDSDLHEHFQSEITTLTHQLLAWQSSEPRMAGLDRRIVHARERLTKAEGALSNNNARGAATVLSVFGLLMLAVVLWMSSPPVLLVVLCIICLIGGLFSMLVSARTRRDRDFVVRQAETELAALESEWITCAPDGRPWTPTPPMPMDAGVFDENEIFAD